MAEPAPIPDLPDLPDDLLRRAQAGDATAMPALRIWLDGHPEIWRQAGDLGRQVRLSLTSNAVGQDLILAESILRQAEAIERSASGPTPSPLEGLLAQRVSVAWLGCHFADMLLAKARREGATPAADQHLHRAQDRAQRQYLVAIKALATVRRLIVPPTLPPILSPPADAAPADTGRSGGTGREFARVGADGGGKSGTPPRGARAGQSRRKRVRALR